MAVHNITIDREKQKKTGKILTLPNSGQWIQYEDDDRIILEHHQGSRLRFRKEKLALVLKELSCENIGTTKDTD